MLLKLFFRKNFITMKVQIGKLTLTFEKLLTFFNRGLKKIFRYVLKDLLSLYFKIRGVLKQKLFLRLEILINKSNRLLESFQLGLQLGKVGL